MELLEFFEIGMKRSVPNLVAKGDIVINLGSGNSPMLGAVNLDLPSWRASDGIPFNDNSVDTVFAMHFLEHLDGRGAIEMLREIERVLKVGGTANIVVPHRISSMAYHDLDHKSFWTEDTWKILFSTPYYDKNRSVDWRFIIGTNLIIGVVERNLAVLTQLIKVEQRWA